MIHDAEIAAANDYVANQTMDTTIQRIKTETIGAMLENVLTKAKTRNTNADTDKIKQDILNSVDQIIINRRNANTNEMQMLNAETQMIWQKQLQEAGLDLQEAKMWVEGAETIIQAATKKKK